MHALLALAGSLVGHAFAIGAVPEAHADGMEVGVFIDASVKGFEGAVLDAVEDHCVAPLVARLQALDVVSRAGTAPLRPDRDAAWREAVRSHGFDLAVVVGWSWLDPEHVAGRRASEDRYRTRCRLEVELLPLRPDAPGLAPRSAEGQSQDAFQLPHLGVGQAVEDAAHSLLGDLEGDVRDWWNEEGARGDPVPVSDVESHEDAVEPDEDRGPAAWGTQENVVVALSALGLLALAWVGRARLLPGLKERRRLFLSYRREDSPDMTGRIYDGLVSAFGAQSVFRDVDSIRPGDEWLRLIQRKIEESDVMVVVIGRNWTGPAGPDGLRKIDREDDHVRAEVATAIDLGIPVVPVLVHGSTMPREADLPADLGGLMKLQAARVRSDGEFHDDLKQLRSTLTSLGRGAR